MTQYKYLLATSIATAVLALSALSPVAAAARETGANASGRCQSALPSFEGALRKRPLALQNESASSAFVTCSYVTSASDTTAVGGFTVWARSVGGQASTLNCTAVVGYDTDPDVQYVAKSVELTADGEQGVIRFTVGTDFPAAFNPYAPISVSCALPAGAALNDMYYIYDDGYAEPAAPTVVAR